MNQLFDYSRSVDETAIIAVANALRALAARSSLFALAARSSLFAVVARP
jgi:hypothetical protein